LWHEADKNLEGYNESLIDQTCSATMADIIWSGLMAGIIWSHTFLPGVRFGLMRMFLDDNKLKWA